MERNYVIDSVKKHISWLEAPPEMSNCIDIAKCIRECLKAYMKDDKSREVQKALEEIKENACDICRWPSEVKDPDDLFTKHCDECTLIAAVDDLMEEF